jgi:hypothetical protein
MPTLILSTLKLSAERDLAEAARRAGWKVVAMEDQSANAPARPLVCYVSTELALAAAARFRLALLEPSLDLLARLPSTLLLREVQFARFRDLSRLKQRAFVKPADPLDKCFDAGVYCDARDIRSRKAIRDDSPVLIAEPVEFLAEYRCFVVGGQVVASSPYISFGRPIWKAWGKGGEKATPSKDALAVCRRLLANRSVPLPPAFVVDVGLIEGSGWAIVEFNPAWSSGLLGVEPARVLPVLERACRDADSLTADDARWIVKRERE